MQSYLQETAYFSITYAITSVALHNTDYDTQFDLQMDYITDQNSTCQ